MLWTIKYQIITDCVMYYVQHFLTTRDGAAAKGDDVLNIQRFPFTTWRGTCSSRLANSICYFKVTHTITNNKSLHSSSTLKCEVLQTMKNIETLTEIQRWKTEIFPFTITLCQRRTSAPIMPWINASPPGQNGRHFGRRQFQMHFL